MHLPRLRTSAALLMIVGGLPAQGFAWLQSPINGHYYATTAPMSWTSAQSLAQSMGGNLATIRSAAENAWVTTHFSTGYEVVWIGLHDTRVEGFFEWVSGEPVTYTNWNQGEPNNGLGIEDWVGIGLPWGGPSYFDRWNDNQDTSSGSSWGYRGLIELSSMMVPSFVAFGSSCPLPQGMPMLQPLAGELPRIGTTSHLRLSNLPPVAVCIFVVGFSSTVNSGPLGSYPLPLELSAFGMPGCHQYVSDESTSFQLGLSGYTDWLLAVPFHVGLGGLEIHVQAMVPTAPLPAATSNAVRARIGW